LDIFEDVFCFNNDYDDIDYFLSYKLYYCDV